MTGLRAFGTYALYKAGQDKFTKWLKQTADKYTGANPDRNDSKQTPANRKGPNGSAVVVHYSELESLAKTVVSETPAQDIPVGIIQTLRDVIAKRRQSSRFFSKKSEKKGDASLRDSNERHQHIIKVLEKVLKILEDKFKGKDHGISKQPGGRGMSDAEAKLSNIFDLLEINDEENGIKEIEDDNVEEETEVASISSKASTTRSRGKKGKKAKNRAKKVQENKRPEPKLDDLEYYMEFDDDDIYFMIYCFFEDFNEIKDFLIERWCDYADGILSLSTVSIITNTAFEIFQHEERKLLAALPRDSNLRDFGAIANMLFLECGLLHVDYENTPKDEVGKNDAIQEEADWVCLPVYWDFLNWLEYSPPGKVPIIYKDLREPLHFDAGLTAVELSNKKRILLREFIAEVAVLKAMKRTGNAEFPVEDELTKGIIHFLQHRRITIWLVLACHVYLEIRYVLDENVTCAHEELLNTGARVKEALERYIEFSKDYARPARVLRTTIGEVESWVEDDFTEEARINLHAPHGIPPEDLEPFCIQRRHPIFCGLMILRFNLTMEELGLAISNNWGQVLAATHIYNMIRQELQDTAPVWEDMNALVTINKPEHLFVGGLPREPVDYLKHYELAIGIKPQMFSKDNRSRIALQGKPRTLVSKAAVSNLFHDRLCFRKEENILTLDNIEMILADTDVPVIDINVQIEQDRSAFFSSRGIADQVSRTQAIMPLQILDSLCQRIHAEEFLLYFNYFSFHQRCTLILRALRDRLDKEIIPVYPPIDVTEDDLPQLPGLIFSKMIHHKEERKDLAGKIAEVMSDVIGENGNEQIMSLMKILSEILSEHQAPLEEAEETASSASEE